MGELDAAGRVSRGGLLRQINELSGKIRRRPVAPGEATPQAQRLDARALTDVLHAVRPVAEIEIPGDKIGLPSDEASQAAANNLAGLLAQNSVISVLRERNLALIREVNLILGEYNREAVNIAVLAAALEQTSATVNDRFPEYEQDAITGERFQDLLRSRMLEEGGGMEIAEADTTRITDLYEELLTNAFLLQENREKIQERRLGKGRSAQLETLLGKLGDPHTTLSGIEAAALESLARHHSVTINEGGNLSRRLQIHIGKEARPPSAGDDLSIDFDQDADAEALVEVGSSGLSWVQDLSHREASSPSGISINDTPLEVPGRPELVHFGDDLKIGPVHLKLIAKDCRTGELDPDKVVTESDAFALVREDSLAT